jgi:hypothetical protein
LDNGRFFLIVGDKKYHSSERFDYAVECQNLDDSAMTTKITRPHGSGILYDILRPLGGVWHYKFRKPGSHPIEPDDDVNIHHG